MNKHGQHTPQPYIMGGQYPLDSKVRFETVFELIDFIENENGKFKFYDGMVIFISELKNFYVYDEVKFNAEDQSFETGEIAEFGYSGENHLLNENLVYPENSIYNGKDYSGKIYNFFSYKDYFDLVDLVLMNTGVGHRIHKMTPGNDSTHKFRTLLTSGNAIDLGYNSNDRSILFHAKAIKNLKNLYVVDPNISEYDGQFNEFSNWSTLKDHIIGNGTAFNPEHKDAFIVFRDEIISSENLNLNNVTYYFDNSKFTYTGYDDAVLSNHEFAEQISINLNTNNRTGLFTSAIKLEGIGVITRTNSGSIIKSKGVFNFEEFYSLENLSQVNSNAYSKIENLGKITLEQKPLDINNDNVQPAIKTNFNEESYQNELGQNIYVTDDIDPNSILDLTDRNEFEYVFENYGDLILKTTNASSMALTDSSFKNGYSGNLIFKFNELVVPFKDTRVDLEKSKIIYNPSDELNLINFKTNYSDIKFDCVLGSKIITDSSPINQGGFNAIFGFNLSMDSSVDCNIDSLLYNSRGINCIVDIQVSTKSISSPINININDIHLESNNENSAVVREDMLYSYNQHLKLNIKKGYVDVNIPRTAFNYLKIGVVLNSDKIISNSIPVVGTNSLADLASGTIYTDSQKNLKIK